MKIFYVISDYFPPFRADIVELFARQIANRGCKIDFLMRRDLSNKKQKEPLKWLSSTVFLTPYNKQVGLAGFLLNQILTIWGDLKIIRVAFYNRYSAIQVRDKCFAGLIAWLSAKLTGAKFFYWMSYAFVESKLYENSKYPTLLSGLVWLKWNFIRLFLYRIILPIADHIFVQSEQMKNDLMKEGITSDKITSVPMGVRADRVGKAEDAREPKTEEPILLYLGTLYKLRQVDILVEVLKRVRVYYPKARLIYVGEGTVSDRRVIETRATRLNLSKEVNITGFVSMEEAWKYVEKADICFSPFLPIEPLLSTSPTKLIEYMAMAKCIVANKHPEQCQIMADSGVGHCVPYDEEAFAEEVCSLLDNPRQAKSKAAKGPDWVRHNRTYDLIASELQSKYNALLKTIC
ncbi:MAG: glycosyltransferase [Candidatus Omnitrophota bacterium]